MRDIKFRARDLSNYSWYYGVPIMTPTGKCRFYYSLGGFIPNIQVLPETVGQYTGLKDKNGVEIYEGDIIGTDRIKKATVLYSDGSFRVDFAPQPEINQIWMNHIEVLGNIHEHPELIK